MPQLPQISKRTFWDVELVEADFERSKEWIITRVFDRGTLDEVLAIIIFYGFEIVKNVRVTTDENLPNHSILLPGQSLN